jgi:large subunit ribosomal protein L33
MPSNRVKITLACSECESRNYNLRKNRQKHPERVEYRKYCRRCGKHTTHKETK